MYRYALVVGALLLAPIPASAITLVVEGGGPYDVTSDSLFTGIVTAEGGAGSYFIDFFAPFGKTIGIADVAVTFENVNTVFSDLTMRWIDGATLNTIVQTVGIDTLTTIFEAPFLDQRLQFDWSDSTLGAGFGFDVITSQVPVPAPFLLLASAIFGLGYVSRRRKTA